MSAMTVLEKIAAAKEPQHVGATCPDCDVSTGTPKSMTGHGFSGAADEMMCSACGAEWTATDVEEIAAAWYGVASYEKGERISAAAMKEQARMEKQRHLYAEAMGQA